MNIKKRGLLVGDLLIIIAVLSTIFLVRYFSNDKKSSFNLNQPISNSSKSSLIILEREILRPYHYKIYQA